MINYHTVNSVKIAELLPESDQVNGPEDILEIMVNAGYSGCNSLIIHSKNLPAAFFKLKSGVAGEILQKFSNYRMKLSIIGDFSEIKSKSLKDFIRESNKWGIISFVPTLEDAISRLDK
jgi:hypothetical protein